MAQIVGEEGTSNRDRSNNLNFSNEPITVMIIKKGK